MTFQQYRGALAGLFTGIVLGLAGCGGGSDASDEATGYPVEAVLAQLYTTPNEVLSSGFIDQAAGDNFYFKTRFTPVVPDTFQGVQRQAVQVESLLTREGAVIWSGTARTFYSTGPLTLYGQVDDQGRYSLHQQAAALPARAQPGDSGAWYTSTDYTGAVNSAVRQTTAVEWAVRDSGKAGTALVCMKTATRDAANPAITNASESCLETDAQGRITGL